ncbi:MAG: (2Fe-2S)-binding protein [Gammaproteobacteria bacterium]
MKTVTLTVNGIPVTVPEGTSAAAAIATVTDVFHRSVRGAPRGPYCGMGQCFECRIRIDGWRMLACLARATAGVAITTDD